MTTTSSGLELAEDALLALLQADATLAALADGLGAPRLGEPQDPPADCTWIYEQARAEQNQLITGQLRGVRRETVIMRVGVFAGGSPSWKTVRDRAKTNAGIIENLVRATPKLGTTEVYDTNLNATDRFGTVLDDESRAALKILTFEIKIDVA
jgi:hypothetical protein